MILQYDSVTIDQIPADAEAVAGYVGGIFPTFSPLVARFPNARHKSIAVSADEDADILDVESGDAVNSQAPAWFRRQKARGLALPGFYTSASNVPALLATLEAAGIKRDEYVLWVAHYTFVQPQAPLEQGGDAVQYTDRALGRNLDASICEPSFWHPTPSPVAKNLPTYGKFYEGPFESHWGALNERHVVEQYDKLREHAHLHEVALHTLRAQLRFLAERVAHEAIEHATEYRPEGGPPAEPVRRPNWREFHRGWRFQQLIHRAEGHRFV